MGIVSVADSDLIRDSSIQDVAEFAVKYHNKVNFCDGPLQLDGIDKAATELLDSGAKVYYLSLHIQPQPYNGGSPIPRPFTTAVACLPPLMKPNLCVGFVGFDAYMMQSSDDEDDHPSPQREAETMEVAKSALKYQTETMEVAKLALKYQDSNECKHVEKVLTCSKSHGLADNDIYYHLTLQVRGIDSRSRLISTLATKFSSMWGDEIFESTPPITITHLPYPNWISYELLQRVRGFGIGVDHYLVFTKENQCGNPIIFFKNADSVRNLSKFATVLDSEQVRDALVPFLCEDNENVDPELVSLIAKNLATLIPFVGAQHANVLLQPLISLSRLGSHVIKSAVGSFEQIAAHTDKHVFAALFLPFILGLANSELLFHRVSSCGLFHIAFSVASPTAEIQYAYLSEDSIPAVRGAVVSSLTKVAAAVTPSQINHIQNIHAHLAHDEHWRVRLLAAEELTSLMKFFEIKRSILHVILDFSKDPNQIVRALVPNLLYEFCGAVVNAIGNDSFMRSYEVLVFSTLEDLLFDSVTIVRAAVARYVLKLWRLLGPDLQGFKILSIIKMLSCDSSNYGRAVSASLVMDVISAHGEYRAPYLRPILITLLKDEDVCVRLNIVTRLDQLIQVIGIELLMTTVDELTKDSSQTAKLVTMAYAPMLASLFVDGIDKFTVLCQQNLNDEYHFVCLAARKSLKILTEIKKDGSVWNATSSKVKEKFGSLKELCFPEDMQQLTKYICSRY